MFSNKISPLQLYKPRNLDGLLESNKLSNAFASRPHEMEGIISYMFGTNKTAGKDGNVINLLTSGLGNVVYIDNAEYRWDLYAQSDRIIDVAAQHLDGGATPGIGNSRFRVPVAEQFFVSGDVILLDDNKTQLRMMGDASHDGENTICTFQIVTQDPSVFVDPKLVGPGARMSKDYSNYEEYSIRGGGVSMAMPFKLQNRLSTFRKSLAVTRGAATDKLAVDIKTADGKTATVWDRAATWQAMYEFAEEIDRAAIYSKKIDGGIIGDNGRPVFSGAGFREQISPNNVWEYNKLTYSYLDDYFRGLAYNAKRNGGNTKFVVLTGQEGMREVNRVLTEENKGRGYMLTDSNKFIGGEGRELELKGFFSKMQLMNGIDVSFKLFPAYDDDRRNRLVDPQTGYPLESSRMTVMNFGTNADGKGNIQKIAKRDSVGIMTEVNGTTSSSGTIKGGKSASGIDGYDVHWVEESGIRLADPTSCGELVRVAG